MTTPAPEHAQITSRYRLIALLDAGNMGAVYRAHDRLAGQDVALKRVTLEIADADDNPEALRLALAHEFRTLAGLRHPHIISVLDYGFDAERQPFFTMELIEGAQTILEVGRQQSVELRVGLLTQALEALAYLHRRGVLHHDLKPGNLVVADGYARLLDFGLAVLAMQQRSDDAFGTLLYLAPEVLDGQPYTEASDLYSLGVIAYELLAGQHPFPASSVQAYLDLVLTAAPNLAAVAGPPELAEVVGQLLARRPERRPATAQAAIAALRAAVGLPSAESRAVRESYLQAATFIGRQAELGLLVDALGQAQRGRGSAWLIGGESGVGKSRLLRELEVQALVDGVTVIRGQAVQEGGAAFRLWRSVLRQLVVASAHVDDMTAAALLPIIPDIGDLLGRPVALAPALEGTAAQTRLLTSIAMLFQQYARPLLLLLEDLQWAEEDLLPLPHLLRSVSDQPLLVVGSYRDDDRPDLAALLPGMRQLALPRLGPEQVAALSAAMLGEAGRQPELLARLQQETEGNTFFLVEVVRALAEEAGDLAQIGRMSLPRRVLAGGVQQVVQRRLARVPSWGQPPLHVAAAVGRQIDAPVLRELFPSLDEPAWLRACADAAVLEVQGERWQFSHDKLRDGLLAQLAPEQLRRAHAAVAEVQDRLYGADDSYAAQLAHHWGQAGLAAREAGACLRAARYARQHGSMSEAARLLKRALETAPAGDRRAMIDIHIEYGKLRTVLGEWNAAAADYQAALSLSSGSDQAAGAQLALGRLYQLRSEYGAALQWLAQAKASYSALGDRMGLAQSLIAEGVVWHRQGEYDQARACMQAGLAHGRAAGDQASIAAALFGLGSVAFNQSDYALARALTDESLTLHRGLGDAQGIANCLSSLGLVAFNQGDYETARGLHEASLAQRRAIGDKNGISTSLTSLGNVAANQGDYAAARVRYAESLALARELGDTHGIAILLNNLGSLAGDEGDYAAAQPLLDESLALRRALNDNFGIVSTLNNLGGLAVGQGDYAAARAHYAESITLGFEIGDKESIAYNLAGLADLAIARGEPERTATLAAATDVVLAEIDSTLAPDMRRMLDSAAARARAALGDAAFQTAWAAGEQLSPAEAVQFALAGPPQGDPPRAD